MSVKHCLSLLVVGLILTACNTIGASTLSTTTPTETQPVPSLAPTNTLRPSPTSTERPASTPSPTVTSSPTRLPTETRKPSPTEAPPPTRTPLVPTADSSVQYRLIDWTPDRAEALIAEMIHYPDGLEGWDRGTYDSCYVVSFGYASFVEAEAALHFPSDPRATQWLWDSAYHGNLQGGPADRVFGRLIADGLNRGETDFAGLEAWFEGYVPAFDLEITPLEPLPGLSSSQILLILAKRGSITAGGVFLWLVSDSAGFSAYPIRDFQQFETGHDGETALHLADLTGDGIPEAITEYGDYRVGFTYNYLEVFDLSQMPPRELVFEPEWDAAELELVPGWESANGTIELQWDYPVDDPTVTRITYGWDGQVFKKIHSEINLREGIELPGIITDTITSKLLQEAERGDFSDTEQLKTLLTSYPLSEYDLFNNPFLPDARDDLRFHLGLALAFYGDSNGAIQQMQTIVESPVVPTSTWITPAQQFLEIYHQPEDLLATCIALNCRSFSFWLPDVLSILPPTSAVSPIDLLRSNGEDFYTTGSFDFDQDGTPEYWGFASDNEYSPLKIIYIEQGHYREVTLFRGNTITNTVKVELAILPHLEGMPIYSFDADNLHLPFAFRKAPDGSVQVMELSNLVATILGESEDALLAGADARAIRDRLAKLQSGQYFESCEWDFYRWHCLRDYYLYLYGFAQELAGDREGAAAAYLELWQSYPYSPYAIMARAKLEPVP